MIVRTDLKDLPGIHVIHRRNQRRVIDGTAGISPASNDIVVAGSERTQETTGLAVEHDTPANLTGLDQRFIDPVSYTHLTLPTTPYV